MGVLNVTPDSFSDGGHFNQVDKAISQAQSMIDAGASIIDVGGESTRPNAAPVSVDEELARVIPVIRGIRENANIAISVDTSKAEVMQLAVEAGANIINDVYALRQPGALEMAAELRVPVCLVHMQAKPETMQNAPCYGNVVDEVNAFFMERLKSCEKIGIAVDSIILDPGFGFGKTLQHNLSLLAHLRAFKAHGCPILVGLSRKSMLGELLDKKADGRVVGSVTAALIAVINGASIVRVHDVAQTSDAFKIYNAVQYGI
ncbi:MAG: dihydropteroate synthase [Cycloclasticus sp. symbiont of Poecilosclerida sp. N]|nr:MAG: dihydropteroate synthase [Cycloclasticus sp. symbiont of Poecilosclerida sp. N]